MKLAVLTMSGALLLGCGSARSAGEGGGDDQVAARVAVAGSLLVRGRILADSALIEPLFLLPASSDAAGEDAAGRYRLVGLDSDETVLFSVRVETAQVSSPRGGAQFELRVGASADVVERLHRVELREGETPLGQRTSRFTAVELSAAVGAADAVTARRLDSTRVALSWDADRFPMVMVTDPDSGAVLAFGRAGRVTVTTGQDSLRVALSDGVRSRARLVQVQQ